MQKSELYMKTSIKYIKLITNCCYVIDHLVTLLTAFGKSLTRETFSTFVRLKPASKGSENNGTHLSDLIQRIHRIEVKVFLKLYVPPPTANR